MKKNCQHSRGWDTEDLWMRFQVQSRMIIGILSLSILYYLRRIRKDAESITLEVQVQFFVFIG